MAPTAGLAPAKTDLKDLSRDDFAFVGIDKMAERRGHAPHATQWRHDLVSTESRLAGPVDVPCVERTFSSLLVAHELENSCYVDWHSRKESHPQPPRSKRGALMIELREH